MRRMHPRLKLTCLDLGLRVTSEGSRKAARGKLKASAFGFPNSAIFSRGGDPIWLEASEAELFLYTLWLGTAGNMFRQSNSYVSKQTATAAVNWFNRNRNFIKELSPRTLDSIAGYFHRIKDDEDVLIAALGKKLAANQLRDIPGFGQLQMVGPGQWQEAV